MHAHAAASHHRSDADDGDGRARLEVQDNGPGVPPENEAKLFQPFFTTKPVGEGTGLGLSVSYGIIQSHGGTIGYRRAPGGGAIFYFELPALHGRDSVIDDHAASITPSPTRDDVRRHRHRAASTRGRHASTSCSIARRSIRRRAASRSTPARSAAPACSTSIDRDDDEIAARRSIAPLAVGRARAAARSTGRAASITCSSTPASTCCRRRSIGCSACGRRAFISAPTAATIDLAPRSVGRRDRCGRRRSQSHRLGGPAGHDPVRDGRGSRGAAAAQGAGAQRAAAADRRRGLRSVGLRRHARRAHRARSASSRSAAGRSSAAARASSSCAAAARSRDSASGATRLTATTRALCR